MVSAAAGRLTVDLQKSRREEETRRQRRRKIHINTIYQAEELINTVIVLVIPGSGSSDLWYSFTSSQEGGSPGSHAR